ncbi:MAG: hypothetical protein HYV63_10230 [Candidatus Schekmanbacteria bacterium]|nr:hypothetical protein [Candidatus Schekmanbacteria bacterium]
MRTSTRAVAFAILAIVSLPAVRAAADSTVVCPNPGDYPIFYVAYKIADLPHHTAKSYFSGETQLIDAENGVHDVNRVVHERVSPIIRTTCSSFQQVAERNWGIARKVLVPGTEELFYYYDARDVRRGLVWIDKDDNSNGGALGIQEYYKCDKQDGSLHYLVANASVYDAGLDRVAMKGAETAKEKYFAVVRAALEEITDRHIREALPTSLKGCQLDNRQGFSVWYKGVEGEEPTVHYDAYDPRPVTLDTLYY